MIRVWDLENQLEFEERESYVEVGFSRIDSIYVSRREVAQACVVSSSCVRLQPALQLEHLRIKSRGGERK